MAQMPIAISFDNISKTFGDGQRPALDDISLDVRCGEFIAVIGASGSGKSTLLRLINRLTDPSAGSVRIEETDLREIDPAATEPAT